MCWHDELGGYRKIRIRNTWAYKCVGLMNWVDTGKKSKKLI